MVIFKKRKQAIDELNAKVDAIDAKLEKFITTWGASFYKYDENNSKLTAVMQEEIKTLVADNEHLKKQMKEVRTAGFFEANQKKSQAKNSKLVDEWLNGSDEVKTNVK